MLRFFYLDKKVVPFDRLLPICSPSTFAYPYMSALFHIYFKVLYLLNLSFSILVDSITVAVYGRTLSERPCYILPMFFYVFFMTALVGQTAERIFTKLSHVVDIRCYL